MGNAPTRTYFRANGERLTCYTKGNVMVVIKPNGDQYWTVKGMVHNEDGPAAMYANGDKEWRIRGELHRENDLPAVVRASGYKAWFANGKRHRIGKPAVEYANGDHEWWTDGVLIQRVTL